MRASLIGNNVYFSFFTKMVFEVLSHLHRFIPIHPSYILKILYSYPYPTYSTYLSHFLSISYTSEKNHSHLHANHVDIAGNEAVVLAAQDITLESHIHPKFLLKIEYSQLSHDHYSHHQLPPS